MNFLRQIMEGKRAGVTAAKEIVDLEKLKVLALQNRSSLQKNCLMAALKRDGLNIIAEFKRRSPSKGVIRGGADPKSISNAYKSGGACAMSVLTEEDYFDGSLDDLRAVKSEVDLPVLRKDFLFDDYQIYEAVAAGADAVLLIVAALDDKTLSRLRELAENELGIDALVEVHDDEELRRAEGCGATLIGVNNRNLRTFEVSLDTSLELADKARSGGVLVSESGLRTKEDLKRLANVGYSGFLIGESLMTADKPDEALRALISE